MLAAIPQSMVLARHIPDINLAVWDHKRSTFNYTALGDSFSAGPSAGDALTSEPLDYSCSRYSKSFPQQLYDDQVFPGVTNFQFLACSGAKKGDVLDEQIPHVGSGGANVVTLTIGGNDVGFGSILNNCIYKLKPTTWNCANTIQWAKDTMSSTRFADSYYDVIQSIFAKNRNAHVHVVGYPTFFNKTTSQCSTTCFKFGAPCDPNELLTTAFRTELNDLTMTLNALISEYVDATDPGTTGGSIKFVDPNPYFRGHRFCEEGVIEPAYDNTNAGFYPFTWFKRDYWYQGFDVPTICAGINENSSYPYTGEVGALIACRIAQNSTLLAKLNSNTAHVSTVFPDPDAGTTGARYIPACFLRIFHPTILGHTLIKQAIYDSLPNNGGRK